MISSPSFCTECHESKSRTEHHPPAVALSGILDSLEQRNRPAIEGQLAYTKFLAMLPHDEVARRDQKKFGARIARAGFALGKTLKTFDFDRLPKLNRAHVHDLATGRYIDEKVCVLMVRQTGVGKSHLAQALGHCAVRQGRDVMFITQTDLLKKPHAARATDLYERKFQQFVRVPLLIVYDFALKLLRAPHDEDFHDLIATRYARSASILTSSLDSSVNGVRPSPTTAFWEPPCSPAFVMVPIRVVIEGEGFRKPKRMPESSENAADKNGKRPQS